MNQENILHEVLTRNRQIEELQKQINSYVAINRQMVKADPNFEDDYTESIESYYINL